MEGLFKIFENNLINWLLLVVLLVILWQKTMPGVFGGRKQRIQSAIDDSLKTKEEGERFFAEQKLRIENAEKDAEKILVEARRVAEEMKAQIAEQTKKDAADLQHKLEQQIATHRQMVITELRSQAATVAVRLAEASLPGAITGNVKHGLQERFVNQLDSIGTSK